MEIPLKMSLPLLGIGIFTLLLSLVFCCYMWKLKREARRELGYQRIQFSTSKKKKLPNDVCPVCLDEFKVKQKLAICPCHHVFHSSCLIEWLHHKNSCPMCKAPVRQQTNNTSESEAAIETTGLVRNNNNVSNA